MQNKKLQHLGSIDLFRDVRGQYVASIDSVRTIGRSGATLTEAVRALADSFKFLESQPVECLEAALDDVCALHTQDPLRLHGYVIRVEDLPRLEDTKFARCIAFGHPQLMNVYMALIRSMPYRRLLRDGKRAIKMINRDGRALIRILGNAGPIFFYATPVVEDPGTACGEAPLGFELQMTRLLPLPPDETPAVAEIMRQSDDIEARASAALAPEHSIESSYSLTVGELSELAGEELQSLVRKTQGVTIPGGMGVASALASLLAYMRKELNESEQPSPKFLSAIIALGEMGIVPEGVLEGPVSLVDDGRAIQCTPTISGGGPPPGPAN